MQIAGKDYKFMLTVKARREIRALCPGGDLEKLGDFLDGPEAEERWTEIMLIMSKGYEEYRAFWDAQEGKIYEPAPLSNELVEWLTMEEYRKLQEEAVEALKRGMGVTVETEEPKGKGRGKKSEIEEKQS